MNQTKINGGWTCGFKPAERFFDHNKKLNAVDSKDLKAPVSVAKILTEGGTPKDYEKMAIEEQTPERVKMEKVQRAKARRKVRERRPQPRQLMLWMPPD